MLDLLVFGTLAYAFGYTGASVVNAHSTRVTERADLERIVNDEKTALNITKNITVALRNESTDLVTKLNDNEYRIEAGRYATKSSIAKAMYEIKDGTIDRKYEYQQKKARYNAMTGIKKFGYGLYMMFATAFHYLDYALVREPKSIWYQTKKTLNY